VNLLDPISIKAIEVYRGPGETPGKYLDSNARCGVAPRRRYRSSAPHGSLTGTPRSPQSRTLLVARVRPWRWAVARRRPIR